MYDPDDRFTITAAGLAALAAEEAPRRAPCECERDDDGALLYCAACIDAMDDGRDEPFTGAEYCNALAPADDEDVIPFP